MQEQGHRYLDHTADVAIEAWGPSQEAVFIEAARAVVEVITEGAPIASTDKCEITLEAIDDEDRLVRWLNEVLWLAIGRGFLFADAAVSLSAAGLQASVSGQSEAADLVITEIKSATYHDLRLRRTEDGRVTARVVLDV